MLKTILMAGAAMGLATTASAQAPTAQADVSLGKISNQYVCRLDMSVSRSQVGSEAAKAAGGMGQVLHIYRDTIRGFAVRMPAQVGTRSHVAELRANNPKVSGCVQDQYARAVVQSKKPGGGGSAGQTTPWGVTRVGGPAAPVSSRTAWVIDSGIDLDHPDLSVDVARSMNFITRDSSPEDLNGHGTHVAGTIGARDNTIGVIGVAPGARVAAVRVLDRRGSGPYSGVIAGVDYVARVGASGDVANMSLTGPAFPDLDDAVVAAAAKGIRFTLAAGNDGDDANKYSPARANGSNIYTVSAFASSGALASWSNYGNPPVDYAEPGVGINSTYKNGGYQSLSGTSMAAPHLAGILMTQSTVSNGGTVTGDSDGEPDTIGVR